VKRVLLTAGLIAAMTGGVAMAQNVDLGIEWDPPLPETIPPDTVLTPQVRVTNYCRYTANSRTIMQLYIDSIRVMPPCTCSAAGLLPGEWTREVFPPMVPEAGWMLKCTLEVTDDTNLTNNRLWWEVRHVLGVVEEQRRTPARSSMIAALVAAEDLERTVGPILDILGRNVTERRRALAPGIYFLRSADGSRWPAARKVVVIR
jgi:hypothetical protein